MRSINLFLLLTFSLPAAVAVAGPVRPTVPREVPTPLAEHIQHRERLIQDALAKGDITAKEAAQLLQQAQDQAKHADGDKSSTATATPVSSPAPASQQH